jgi:hypothetical protein
MHATPPNFPKTSSHAHSFHFVFPLQFRRLNLREEIEAETHPLKGHAFPVRPFLCIVRNAIEEGY